MVTFARSDYSSLAPVLKAIAADLEMDYRLLVGGAHLLPAFGSTVRQIEDDGFAIHDRVPMPLASDTPEAIVQAVGQGMSHLAPILARWGQDVLLCVGDRLELLAAAGAALALRVPVAHISGGDVTEGAIDNQVRHAVSKMSHLHFVAMPQHARRLEQMGEETRRIFVTGDPALDALRSQPLLTRPQLSEALGLSLAPPVLLVTHHPATLGEDSPAQQMEPLFAALDMVEGTLIFTAPNADADYERITERIQAYVRGRSGAAFFHSLGQHRYYSLLAQADVMVGNSSSGIWEAPTFRLPVVNIGARQQGRLRAANVIQAEVQAQAIAAAIRQALEPAFRTALSGLQNPYGDGRAAERIVAALKATAGDARLLLKQFQDLPGESAHLCVTR